MIIFMIVVVFYWKMEWKRMSVCSEATMAATVLATGNALGLGQDVMPDRFIGPIFDAVAGIESVTVEISDDGIAWSTSPKSIEFNELAKFDSARVTIVGP